MIVSPKAKVVIAFAGGAINPVSLIVGEGAFLVVTRD